VSCTKTAELIEIPSGMFSGVRSGKTEPLLQAAQNLMLPHGGAMGFLVHWKALQSIKRDLWRGWIKKKSCAKTGGSILTIYTSYDVFSRKDVRLGTV